MRLGPGLSFSWKRAIGLTAARQRLSRSIGIPLSRQGMERKLGRAIFKGVGCLLPILVFILVALWVLL